MANAQRDRGKEQFWRQTLARWRQSELTVRAYCAQYGLSEPSFYAWRKVLARRDRRAAEPAGPAAVFVPVQIVPEPGVAIEIVMPQGHVVRVRPGFDRQTLRHVLATLDEERSC
jgi:hypothetical protein